MQIEDIKLRFIERFGIRTNEGGETDDMAWRETKKEITPLLEKTYKGGEIKNFYKLWREEII
jgi:hypothetical protein